MPKGIKNEPSMFQRMVSHVLAGTRESDIYIDECLTGTPNQGDVALTTFRSGLQAPDRRGQAMAQGDYIFIEKNPVQCK